jgi:hypothetical protein
MVNTEPPHPFLRHRMDAESGGPLEHQRRDGVAEGDHPHPMHGCHELRTAGSILEYLQEEEDDGDPLKIYLHGQSDFKAQQRPRRETFRHLDDSFPEGEAHATSTPSPPIRHYHHRQAKDAVSILRRRSAVASKDTDDWQAVFRMLSVETQSRTDGVDIPPDENANKNGQEPSPHSSSDADHHRSLRVPWYCPPVQRQHWDDDQVLPHINWGDMFYDLFYIAAGKCRICYGAYVALCPSLLCFF